MTHPRVVVGSRFPIEVLRGLETLRGEDIELPERGRLLHVQMRRFAGCPICDLHLRRISARSDEIDRAGVDEVVVFHSTIAELADFEENLPMAVAGDPAKHLYAALGMEAAWSAYLNPRLLRHLPGIIGEILSDAHQGRGLRLGPTGGELGRPADVLVDGEARVVGVHYGEHASDQWTVDELIAEARAIST